MSTQTTLKNLIKARMRIRGALRLGHSRSYINRHWLEDYYVLNVQLYNKGTLDHDSFQRVLGLS